MRRASARTRTASGRFVCALAVCLVWMTACAAPGVDPAPVVTPAGPPELVLEEGPIAAARQAEASELVVRGESALAGGQAEEALRFSTRVVEEFPAASVSGRALALQARAYLALGDGPRADAAAERYLRLLDAEDPRGAPLRLLQADAVASEPAEAILRLVRIGPGAPAASSAQATERARALVLTLSREELDAAIGSAAPGGAVLPVVEARLAALALGGPDPARAGTLARAALDHGATGPDRVLAEAVLQGRFPPGYVTVRRVKLAAVLPLEGAPALSAFSRLILEGIEVAVAMEDGIDLEVELDIFDDRGNPTLTAQLVGRAEAEGAAAVLGFLQELTLDVADDARTTGVALVSPTARVSSASGAGVYSLDGADEAGLRALARVAAAAGYRRAAFIESTSPISVEEATVLQRELGALGIPTVTRRSYAEGSTFFQSQIAAVRDALRGDEIRSGHFSRPDSIGRPSIPPVALFVPVSAEDVELLAPQIIHFGLDTLGIDVFGTAGWTDAETLRRVDARHTNGVIATAPVDAGPATPGYARFRAAYEERFRRSLVSPVPAVGYDAALLLIEAFRRGATTPDEVRRALEQLQDVEGATGVFSVVDGRIVRRTRPVLIQNRSLNPIPTG